MIKFDLYLCGPMTGLPDLNHPAFNAAAKALRDAGYTVFNPVENGLPTTAAWEEHMRVDIKQLMDCRDVALLPGWRQSTGAKLETRIATFLGMVSVDVEQWIGFKTAKSVTEGIPREAFMAGVSAGYEQAHEDAIKFSKAEQHLLAKAIKRAAIANAEGGAV